MPRFAFGKRKSTAEGDNDVAPSSFRVLDRSEVNDGNVKTFDGGARFSRQGLPRTTVSDLAYEEDLFADFKPNTTNRYVGFIPVHGHGVGGCRGHCSNFPYGECQPWSPRQLVSRFPVRIIGAIGGAKSQC